jgi:hypothetical protein
MISLMIHDVCSRAETITKMIKVVGLTNDELKYELIKGLINELDRFATYESRRDCDCPQYIRTRFFYI